MAEKLLSYKILVVEDDRVSRELMEHMLASSDGILFENCFCGSLKEALNMMESHIYDAVLLDLNLPDSEGMDTVKAMVRIHEHVPVVVITGGYGEAQGIRALSEGASDYLVKGNFDRGTLIKSMQYAVERKKVELKLMMAQKELARSEIMSALTILISNTTHKIYNPLSIISEKVEVSLILGNLDDETEKAMRVISAEGEKIRILVRELFRLLDRIH